MKLLIVFLIVTNEYAKHSRITAIGALCDKGTGGS